MRATHMGALLFLIWALPGNVWAQADQALSNCRFNKIGDQCRVELHHDGINSIAFSPNGKLVATGSGDGTAKILNLETGDISVIRHAPKVASYINKLTSSEVAYAVNSVQFSADSKLLLTASNFKVKVNNVVNGQESILDEENFLLSTRTADFSPDNKYVSIYNTDNKVIKIINRDSLETRHLKTSAEEIISATFDAKEQGIHILEDGDNGLTRRYTDLKADINKVEALKSYKKKFEFMLLNSTQTNGLQLLRSYGQYKPKPYPYQYELTDEICYVTELTKFPEWKRTVLSANQICSESKDKDQIAKVGAFSNDGSRLIIGYQETVVKIFDTLGETKMIFLFDGSPISTVAISPNGQIGMAATVDGKVILGDLENDLKLNIPTKSAAISMAISPSNTKAVTGNKDGSISIISLKNISNLRSLHGNSGSNI